MNEPQSIENVPSNAEGMTRRHLIAGVLAGTAAAALRAAAASSLPGAAGPMDEAAWSRVREQFVLRDGLTMVNAANLCPAPATVLRRYVELTRDVDQDPSSQNRAKFSRLRAESRKALAAQIGAVASEIALVRNTSEANNTVVAGLELAAGDEVVVWNQNHPTNHLSWDIRGDREGFNVIKVDTPPVPASGDALIQAFARVMTPRTRILAVSHVSNLTGIRLPVDALCRLAREQGVLTIVDGAQSFGSLAVNVRKMGCDFYTGSAHKWFMGPREAGILYVASRHIEKLWPLSVGIGYERALANGAEKFETLGQRDDAALASLAETSKFHRTLGPEAIEGRVKRLQSHLQDGIGRIKGTSIHTPSDPALRAGVVVFQVEGVDPRKAVESLYREHGVGCAAMGGEFAGIRFSPHVYNSMEEMERLVGIVGRMAG